MAAHTGKLGQVCRSTLEPLIREANLGEIDGYICRRYLIDKIPHVEIAGELLERFSVRMDRSTVSRHWSKCRHRLNQIRTQAGEPA